MAIESVSVNEGTDKAIAADLIGGTTYYQVVKLAHGADGTATLVETAAPLPTTDAGLSTKIGEVQASPTANTILDRLKTLAGLTGEVQASPTANTVLDRLKALLTGIILAAGEAHIGQVGGHSDIISPTVTVDTSIYAAGDVCGGKLTLTNAARVSAGGVMLQNIHILDNANVKPTGDILIFNADPSAATTTNNSAFAYSTDFTKQIARIEVKAEHWKTINSKASAIVPYLGRVLKPATGTTLYAVFVLDNTPTFAATTDLSIGFGLLKD